MLNALHHTLAHTNRIKAGSQDAHMLQLVVSGNEANAGMSKAIALNASPP